MYHTNGHLTHPYTTLQPHLGTRCGCCPTHVAHKTLLAARDTPALLDSRFFKPFLHLPYRCRERERRGCTIRARAGGPSRLVTRGSNPPPRTQESARHHKTKTIVPGLTLGSQEKPTMKLPYNSRSPLSMGRTIFAPNRLGLSSPGKQTQASETQPTLLRRSNRTHRQHGRQPSKTLHGMSQKQITSAKKKKKHLFMMGNPALLHPHADTRK